MLRDRALSALVFVPPLVVVLFLGEPWLAALVAVLLCVGAWEAFRLLARAGFVAPLPAGVAASLAVGAAIAVTGPSGWFAARVSVPPGQSLALAGLLVAAVVVVLAAVLGFREKDTRLGFVTWMALVFGALYVGQLGFLVRLGEAVPALPGSAPVAWFGAARCWTLLVVLIVWSFDTGAYFVGTRLGKRKFLGHISPSKSYWGLAGGLVAASVVAIAGTYLLGQPPVTGLVLGPLVGLAAQCGDLAESMLKRAAATKDSSQLIPGHGGILDRIDSFLFAAPVATLYVAAFVR